MSQSKQTRRLSATAAMARVSTLRTGLRKLNLVGNYYIPGPASSETSANRLLPRFRYTTLRSR